VSGGAGGQLLVELGHRGHVGDGHQVAATEPTDFALDTALLMAALHAGLTEETVEAIVGAQSDEPVRLDPVATPKHPLNRRLQIVVADPSQTPTEMLEGVDVAVQEHLLALVPVGPGRPGPMPTDA